MKSISIHPHRSPRRGVLAPLVAIALLVAMAGVALVLDYIWLGMARVELTSAAEGGALAAASVLAGDDLLRAESDVAPRLAQARQRARDIAGQNVVAGRLVELSRGVEEDVQFGVLATDPQGITRFLQTDYAPTTVRIITRMSRDRNNPVALFMQGVTGVAAGDVAAIADATIDNRIVGVRPLPGAAVPALPLAILLDDPTGKRQAWQTSIELRKGQDRYGYDPAARQVTEGPDGIPEIVLRSADINQEADQTNVALIEFHGNDYPNSFMNQTARGWTPDDLADFNGELSLTSGPLSLAARGVIGPDAADALADAIGEPRICLLYSRLEMQPQTGWGSLQTAGLVSGRVLQITRKQGQVREIVFQPSVVATRTAVLAASESAEPAAANKYIYKLSLTQ